MKKSRLVIFLLVFLIFLIPMEHKYDKPFRSFSKTLIPQGLKISTNYDKKIYFYISDIVVLFLFCSSLFWAKISLKRFFGHPLWVVFFCAAFSIAASPFAHYPLAYIRLLQLLTAILLFSFLASSELKITRALFLAFSIAGLLQSAIAIAQYFYQAPLGLHLLGELKQLCTIAVPEGKRWLFDNFSKKVGPNSVCRASATMEHPNILGGFLVLTILVTYAIISSSKKGKGFWAITLPLQFFALSITYSRSALFGLSLATVIWFLQNRDRFLACIVALSVAISALLLNEQFIHRGGIVNYNESVKNSDSVRILHQKTAIDIIKENPLYGLGFGQFSERSGHFLPSNCSAYERATGPHNIYLMLACETGLISLFSFLFFIAMLLKASFFKIVKTLETTTLSAIFAAFLFIGCCDFYFLIFQPGKLMFFLIAGLLASHVQYAKKKELIRI